MARKKDTENLQETSRQVAGKSQATRKKKQEIIQEPNKELPEQVYIWQEGDNIDKVAKIITGYSWKKWELLNYSEVNASDLKPGTILKWRL